MGNWENLPQELLAHLYSYLSKRDRLSCSLVCSKWRDGLDHVMLWKTMVVHIDTDLMEPSTILLVRDYCKYIKNLEFGWAIPHRNHRFTQVKYKELTKRAVRFFLILYDNYIQIQCLRIFNWFDFLSFQKVTYHISRFLKNQMNLKKITFDNINMHSANYMKLLTSCLGSRYSITNFDIRSCYCCQSTFDSVYFRSCIEQLSYLKTFKLDYFILSCELIDSILTSKNRCLENLEVILKEQIWNDCIIDDEQWSMLSSACPNLKVTFIISKLSLFWYCSLKVKNSYPGNIYHYGELSLYLKQSIPLVSLSIVLPRVLERGGRCNFRKTLNLIVNLYHRTLETIDLHVKNDGEILDDILLMMIRRCNKLKNFIFNGILDNPNAIEAAIQDIDVRCFCILPNGHPEKHFFFNRVSKEEIVDIRNKRVQLTIIKRKNNPTCTLLIIN